MKRRERRAPWMARRQVTPPLNLLASETPALRGSRSLFLRILHIDSDFRAVGADFGHIHGLAEDGQRVKLTGGFGAEIVTDFPNALRQLVDEQRHFPVA